MDDAVVQAVVDEWIPVNDAICLRLQRELDQQQARERTAFETIQAASLSASPLGSPFGSAFVVPTRKIASVLATSASTVSSATEDTTLQVLDEMPQCSGLQNINHQTVFRADGTKHSYYTLPANYPLELASPEPVFDVYDDDMDGCSTEFEDVLTGTSEQLADEEEQHENIQALKCFRKPQFSVEKPTVDVFILTNDQSSSVTAPLSVAAQAAGLDAVLCSKTDIIANSESLLVPNLQLPWNLHDASHVFTEKHVCDVYEENSACLNIASDVRDFTQLQKQDDERAGICSVLKASNSFVTRSTQLSIEDGMREVRLLWDPGASISLHSNKPMPHEKLGYMAMVFRKALNLCNQVDIYVQQLRGSRWNMLVTHEGRKEWDPGDTNLHVLFKFAAGATKLQCLYACKSGMVQVLAMQFSVRRRAPNFESTIIYPYALGPVWTEVNLQQLSDPLKVLVTQERRKEWDPGVHNIQSSTPTGDIIAITCTHALGVGWIDVEATATAVLILAVPCSQGKCLAKHSLCSCQMVIAEQLINFPSCATTSVHVTKRKFSLEVLLIAETLQNVSEFREVQLNCSGINFGITCIQFWLTFCEWIAKVITSAVSVELSQS